MASIRVQRKHPLLFMVLGCFMLLIGFSCIVTAFDQPIYPVDMTAVSPEILTAGGYFIEDAVIFDQYAYTEENHRTVSYEYAVAFCMDNGQWVIASMKQKPSDALYETINAYLEDDTQYISDLRMPMYVTIGSLGTTFRDYLDNYIEKVFEADDNDFLPVYYELTYRGSTDAEYQASLEKDKRLSILVGAIIVLSGILFFSIGLAQRRKKLDEKHLENRETPDSSTFS